jgi:hypothetical protein
MKLEKRKPSGREKSEESIQLLEQLREKLYVNDISAARRAAFVLSWQQEDGLDILKEALYGDSLRVTKIAAVYGMRSMHGRMKKAAFGVLEEGLKHHRTAVRNACNHALSLANQKNGNPVSSKLKREKFNIREVPRKKVSRGKHRSKRMHEQRHRR